VASGVVASGVVASGVVASGVVAAGVVFSPAESLVEPPTQEVSNNNGRTAIKNFLFIII
jgi:hypothetical protein